MCNTHVPIDQLRADVESGSIDTVLAVFADHHGRMIGKRTYGGFFLDTVLAEGTENCDYLIACDLDYTPLPGFRWASYDQGYGDMRGVVDQSTIRYLPWLDRTALVIVDLVDVESGAPVEVSPRRILQRQADAAASGRVHRQVRQRDRVLLVQTDLRRRPRRRLPDADPQLAVGRGLQHPPDDEGGERRGAIRRGLTAAGLPVEFSKGEAGRGQHEINLTYQDAVEMADINLCSRTPSRRSPRPHGVSATFMAKPHFDDAGSSFHIHSSLWSPDGSTSLMAGDDEHQLSDAFRWYLGGQLATAAEFSLLVAPTVNSYKRFLPGELGADRDRVGSRQSHARLPSRRAWAVTARREPHSRRRRQHLSRLRRDDRRRAVRAGQQDRPGTRLPGQRLYGERPATRPGDLRRSDRSVARQQDRQGALRRRRPPPRAALRRDRVGGVQPHRHRLGTAPLLRADLDGGAV